MQPIKSARLRGGRFLRETIVRPIVAPTYMRLWYAGGAWRRATWRGWQCRKSPFDLWTYQELITATRPTLILETGTLAGGSALFFADMLTLTDGGEVVTVDVEAADRLPDDPRITYLAGSSIDPGIVDKMTDTAARHERVMVVLDSEHRAEHVLAELRAYSPLVTPGCYLVVEDGCMNGHPVRWRNGPGPLEATRRFLKETDRFRVDRSQVKHYVTLNPDGYLLRLAERVEPGA